MVLLAGGALAVEPPAAPLALRIGYEIGAEQSRNAVPAALAPSPDRPLLPLIVRLTAVPADESAEAALAASVERLTAAGYEPAIGLEPAGPPPEAEDAAAVTAWEEFVRRTARRLGPSVRLWELPDLSGGIADPVEKRRREAFFIKKTSTLVRAEAGKPVLVAMPALQGADVEHLRLLWDEGIEPYVDVVPMIPRPGADQMSQAAEVAKAIAALSPARTLWVRGVHLRGAGLDGFQAPPVPVLEEAAIGRITRAAFEGIDAGAAVITFALPERPGTWPERIDALVRVRSVLAAGLAPLPETRARFTDAGGAPVGILRSLSLLDPATGALVIGWWPRAIGEEGAQIPAEAKLHIEARRPGVPLLYDPGSGRSQTPAFTAVQGGAEGTVPVADRPLAVLLTENSANALAGAPAEPEQAGGKERLEVIAERGLTAEEIISHHQEVAARQSGRLAHWTADGQIEFHFKLGAGSETLDVAFRGGFFWDTQTGPEWEFREYLINGAVAPWKRFPELPLVQPEKVATLPLDLTLDRSYAYTLDGEDTYEGRACWVLSFEPLDPEHTLYRGKVWIDKATFNRVRTSTVQTKLETPFVSSEERDTYAPVETSEGVFWLLTRVEGQQIYTTAGRNFIVLREVHLDGIAVNGPEFDRQRQEAYTSDNRMLRETEHGFRYLDRTPEGGRVVREKEDTSQLFGLGGVLWDRSRDYPLPLAGFDWFEFHLGGGPVQMNVFFAGVVAQAGVTHPDLWGTRLEAGADFYGLFVNGTDTQFEQGFENERRDVDSKSQSLEAHLGRSLGSFTKLRGTVGWTNAGYSRSDRTASAFTVPEDTGESYGSLNLTFDRGGWGAGGTVEAVKRSDWPFWGCAPGKKCGSAAPVPDWSPAHQDFTRYDVSLSKEWYLPKLQKIRAAAEGYGGHDLDRFSRHQFGFFGTNLAGFAGSGVRFDDGAILRAGWAFTLAEAIRFGATLEGARVRDESRPEGWQSHSGLALTANFLGPWETILRLQAGYAIQSDLPELQGKVDVYLVVLKLFDGKHGQ